MISIDQTFSSNILCHKQMLKRLATSVQQSFRKREQAANQKRKVWDATTSLDTISDVMSKKRYMVSLCVIFGQTSNRAFRAAWQTRRWA